VSDLTEGWAVLMLAQHFNYRQNFCFPFVHLFGGEMDLAVISRAGYLWEIEVKLSRRDWLVDIKKRKWAHPGRRYVSRFFYAVPPEMVGNPPDFVAETTGLLELRDTNVKQIRTARRCKAPALGRGHMRGLFASTYYRYWDAQFHNHRQGVRHRRAA